jgi:hypothetical protein
MKKLFNLIAAIATAILTPISFEEWLMAIDGEEPPKNLKPKAKRARRGGGWLKPGLALWHWRTKPWLESHALTRYYRFWIFRVTVETRRGF